MRLIPATVGDRGADIRRAQIILGLSPADGLFDENMAARVRGVQLVAGLHPSGELDERTALVIEGMAAQRG